MDLAALKTELETGHPETGAYDADAALAAGQLNEGNRTLPRATMTGSEVLNAVVGSEFTALDATEKQMLWDIVHLGTVNPFGVEQTLMVSIFGAGAGTILALAAARQRPVSRAVEIGLGLVRAGDVERARAL